MPVCINKGVISERNQFRPIDTLLNEGERDLRSVAGEFGAVSSRVLASIKSNWDRNNYMPYKTFEWNGACTAVRPC